MLLVTGDDVGLLKAHALAAPAPAIASDQSAEATPAATGKRSKLGFETASIVGTVDAASAITLIRSVPRALAGDSEALLAVVRRDGAVELFNPADGAGREIARLGLCATTKSAVQQAPERVLDLRITADGRLIACSSRGKLFVGQGHVGEGGHFAMDELAEHRLPHAELHAFAVHPDDANVFATGGRECSLAVYNVGKLYSDENAADRKVQPVWRAKNAKTDKYRDNPPVWVTGIAWLGAERFAAVTAYSEVLVYDMAAARRPVAAHTVGDKPLRICRAAGDGASLLVFSDNVGGLGVFDLAAGKLRGMLKGFVGTVTDVWVHPAQPLAAAVALDRYLRVYDTETRALVQEIYLKQRTDVLWESLGVVEDDRSDEEANPSKRQKVDR